MAIVEKIRGNRLQILNQFLLFVVQLESTNFLSRVIAFHLFYDNAPFSTLLDSELKLHPTI